MTVRRRVGIKRPPVKKLANCENIDMVAGFTITIWGTRSRRRAGEMRIGDAVDYPIFVERIFIWGDRMVHKRSRVWMRMFVDPGGVRVRMVRWGDWGRVA